MKKIKEKVKWYKAAIRWLWENRTWQSSRQKWKAFDRAMKEENKNG